MALYDIAMVLIVLIGVVQGAWRGMAWQLAPIASLVLGYIVALPLSTELAPYFGSSAPLNQFVAMLALYFAVSLVVYLIARSIKESIARFKLQEYDRHLGSILGGAKGLLFAMVVTFFLVAMSPPARAYILGTRSGHAAGMAMEELHSIMPEALHDLLHEHLCPPDEVLADGTHQHAHDHGDGHAGHSHAHDETVHRQADGSIQPVDHLEELLPMGVKLLMNEEPADAAVPANASGHTQIADGPSASQFE